LSTTAPLRGSDACPGLRSGTVARLGLARGKSGEDIDRLVPGPQHVAEWTRHAVTAHRKLSHFVWDGPPGRMPCRRAQGGELPRSRR
jgi:hypothetical protein